MEQNGRKICSLDGIEDGFSKLDAGIPYKSVRTFRKANRNELDLLEETIMKWEVDGVTNLMIWEEGKKEEGILYLYAVDELLKLVDSMNKIPDEQKDLDVLQRIQRIGNLVHMAMSRLEDEFRALIEKHSEIVDPDSVFDVASSGGGSFMRRDSLDEDEEEESVIVAPPVETLEFTMDFLPADVADQLGEIAARLVRAGYETECRHVYGSVRKAFLEESVSRLGFEKMGIEEVQRIPWEILEVEIAKWRQIVKASVNVFMTSERKLCDKIFSGFSSIGDTCFCEISKGILLQLLSFSEAIAMSKRAPEKLFKILDMYETLWEVVPQVKMLFAGENCSDLKGEASSVCLQLGEAARSTLLELENAIQRDVARSAVAGGAIHPLTRYVMNYMRLACAYRNTLDKVFNEEDGKSQEFAMIDEDDDNDRAFDRSISRHDSSSPLSMQIIAIMDLLENNLLEKSKLYKDPALGYVFLMNNGRYIVQKVRDEEIHNLLGDDWVRRHSTIVRQYHKSYQRSSLVKILSFLKDEGIYVSGNFSSGVSKTVLKERFKAFNAMFDEIHKTQSSWIVADEQLRTELRISIVEGVIPAYRAFLGRFQNHLDHPEKYIKYGPEELEARINELFEGTTNSLGRRRSS